jgi:integrase
MTRPRNATTKIPAKTAQSPHEWSYIAGEKGSNRVRVYVRGPVIWIDYKLEHGRRVKRSLGHTDRDRAKEAADTLAAKFRKDLARPAGVTLRSLFDMYEKEVTPTKALTTQAHDRRAFAMLLAAFGADRRPESLNVRDWTSFIARRRSGAIGPMKIRRRTGVRANVIRSDLKLLLAVLNWAERARDDRGGYLLERNPLRGLATPTEESPSRPVLSADQFATVRTKAAELSTAAEVFVCLLWFTGHRGASVRQLRWDDIDLERRAVRWRADVDKIGYEHENPLHTELVPVLEKARVVAELTGEMFLFPCPRKTTEPMTRDDSSRLWRLIADASGIKAGSRFGTHSFRRAFANRLRDVPLRDLKDLGGWKTQKTVVDTYQQPDQDAQRTALERLTRVNG